MFHSASGIFNGDFSGFTGTHVRFMWVLEAILGSFGSFKEAIAGLPGSQVSYKPLQPASFQN